MDYESYYLDLLDMMNSSFKKIASGKYDKKDVERLFELSKTGRYPHIFAEMAESFSMMIKVEAIVVPHHHFELDSTRLLSHRNALLFETIHMPFCRYRVQAVSYGPCPAFHK